MDSNVELVVRAASHSKHIYGPSRESLCGYLCCSCSSSTIWDTVPVCVSVGECLSQLALLFVSLRYLVKLWMQQLSVGPCVVFTARAEEYIPLMDDTVCPPAAVCESETGTTVSQRSTIYTQRTNVQHRPQNLKTYRHIQTHFEQKKLFFQHSFVGKIICINIIYQQ